MSGLMKTFVLIIVLICLGLIPSCKKEDIHPFNLTTISAGGVDLTATSPNNVAVTAVITATFTANIDPSSVTVSSINMTRNYDGANIILTLIAAKNILSIRSTTNLISGASYTLSVTSALHSSNGVAFQSFTSTFKTIGTFVPSNQVAYWSFEGIPDDVVGSHDPITTDDALITYVKSKNIESGMAASFDGKTSIEQILSGSTLLTPEFTITFWMWLNSDNHLTANGNQKGSYVFGIGNVHGLQFDVDPNYAWCRFSHGLFLSDGTTTTTDFQFYANGRTKDNLASEKADSIKLGIDNATTVCQNLGTSGLKSKLDKVWAQVAFTFEDSTKTRSMYINGELMYQQDLGLLDTTYVLPAIRPLYKAARLQFLPDITARYDDMLVFGFWQSKLNTYNGISTEYSNPDSNHFQGLLDDVRIFNRALTALEISLVYKDEKP